jgi:3,4-dihydroxy-2-butanone 4-phosphate synthase
MATHAEIKQALLRVAGNPVSGVIVELVDEFARAVVALDAEPTKETRVIVAREKR